MGQHARRAAETFKAALDLNVAERAAFLDAECAGDAHLRCEVEALLAADARAEAFLSTPPAGRIGADPLLGRQVGGYTIVSRIAAGGMGVVYEAVHERLGRTAALKIVRGGLVGDAVLRRFNYEARFLARLSHPAIAQIHEVGVYLADGAALPYFAMEFIPNARTIVEYANAHRLSTERRVQLFLQACDAVQYAHQRGIIHRDIKPSNVLVAEDAAGSGSSIQPLVKVIDFGVARLINPDVASTTMHTADGSLVGTLQYMSPEQCGPEAADVDVRSDVYSLGVMLYELLAERLPYDLQRAGLVEGMRLIREAVPARLSAVNSVLRGDLDTITLKALEKDRERRYASVAELAEDLRRNLRNEPIAAKRDSGWYILRTSLKRYRRAVAVAGAFLVVAVAAAVALSILYAQQGRLLVEVEAQRDKAKEESYAATIAAADASINAEDGGAAIARLKGVPAELRNWEWRYLASQADSSIASWYGPTDSIVSRLAFSTSGDYIAAQFWIPEQRVIIRIFNRQSRESVAEIALSKDSVMPLEFVAGKDVVMYYDGVGAMVWFDVATRREVGRHPIPFWHPEDAVWTVSPDGRYVVFAAMKRNQVLVVDMETDLIVSEHPMPPPTRWTSTIRLDPATERVACGEDDGTVHVYALKSNEEICRIATPGGPVYSVALHDNGRLLATSTGEVGQLQLWEFGPRLDAGTGNQGGYDGCACRAVAQLQGGGQRKGGMAFSPDGGLLAAPSEDKAVRIWSVPDGHLQTTLRGHGTGATSLDFSADGEHLVSGARGGVVKLWSLRRPGAQRVFRDVSSSLRAIAFTADGQRLRICDGATMFQLDIADGRRFMPIPLRVELDQSHMIVGPGDRAMTIGAPDGGVYIREMGRDEPPQPIGRHGSAPLVAGDAAQRVLVSADADAIAVWDWPAGREMRRFAGPHSAVQALNMCRDGTRIALGVEYGDLLLCDPQTGALSVLASDALGGARASVVMLSPAADALIAAANNGMVGAWEVPSGRPLWRTSLQMGDIWCLAFNPEGSRLGVGGRDRSVRLLDSRSGRELMALRGPTGTVMQMAFSPDGERLAATSWGGEVFVWSAEAAGGEDRKAVEP